MDEYRLGQRAAIEYVMKAFNDGYKFVLLEAPTGSGKSAVAYTLSQSIETSYYLAPQKFLQDQLTRDFGEGGKHVGKLCPMVALKGRNAYPCNYWERVLTDPNKSFEELEGMPEKRKRYQALAFRKLGCDQGQCKRDGKSKLKYCVEPRASCPYFKQLYRAMRSRICLMNFHSFLFQSSIVPNFGPRDLLIIDEAHNAEDILLQFIEFRISDRYFVKEKIRFPELGLVEEYIDYFLEIRLEELMRRKLRMARNLDQPKEAAEWESRILRLGFLMKADPNKWVCQWEEVSSGASRTVSIKPIFIDDFANKYLFNMGAKVLMMSATILSKKAMCEALGIPSDSAKSLSLASTFPPENRRLHYRSCGSMSYANKAETLPLIVEEVDRLCNFHKDQRGIIHTHTFEIADRLLKECSKEVRKRFLFQRSSEFDGDKFLLLEKHKKMKNSIIVAPAMHEGLDLVGDLGRFQIICKVPYPSKADPQIAARMKISGEYYNWRTATKLIQSYGRIYRHKADHGVTYVLDSNFRHFVLDNDYLMPDWFREALVWDD
jgi:Rad3-related DNA helicase